MTLADAHIHFFRRGYHRAGTPALLGSGEWACYESLRVVHDVDLALVIGYEADGIDPTNNDYIAELSATRPWLKTLAFMPCEPAPTPEAIAAHLNAGHRGLAVYAATASQAAMVLNWPRAVWATLADRDAVVSFNARPESIAILSGLVRTWPRIACLFSHLGLPGVLPARASRASIAERLAPLLSLGDCANAYVKISGTYATSDPPHAFPHHGAQAAIEIALESFGAARCLWASDFAPALEYVSFPQTIDLPGLARLGPSERRLVFHDNLARLLAVQPQSAG